MRRLFQFATSVAVSGVFLAGAMPSSIAAQAPASLAQAQHLLTAGNAAEAGRLLDDYLRSHPQSADAWSLLGVVKAQQGDNAEAETSLRKALSIAPHLLSAQTNLGHLLLAEQRPSDALPHLDAAMRAQPGNAELRDMYVSAAEQTALAQGREGDRKTALATLLSAKAEAPHEFRLLLDLAILEDDARLLKDAERDIGEARAMHPDDLKALYTEARVKMDLQKMSAAEADMRAYLKASPEDATAHYGLGRILEITQHPDEAKAEFERSITLAPNQAESYYQIGQMALDHGDFATAQQQCREALAHDPHHPGALTALGIAAFRLKQYPEAVASLAQAVAAAPNYQRAHYYYGLALARTGQKEAADRELKLAAAMADAENRRDAQHLELGAGSSPQP